VTLFGGDTGARAGRISRETTRKNKSRFSSSIASLGPVRSLLTAFVTFCRFNRSAFAPSRIPSNVEPKKARLFFIRFLNSTHRGRSRIPIPFQSFNTKTLSLKSYDKSHEDGRQKLFNSTCAFALFTIRLWWEPSSVHELA